MKAQFKTIHGNDFGTPQWLFDKLNAEFNFSCDLACTGENKKLMHGLTYPEIDSLTVDWHKIPGWLWLNPPYSPLKPWIEKAQKEFLLGAKIVLLCPPIISSRYFSKTPPAEIRLILGRISFVRNGKEMPGNTQDSMIAVFGPPVVPKLSYVERDTLRLVPKTQAASAEKRADGEK